MLAPFGNDVADAVSVADEPWALAAWAVAGRAAVARIAPSATVIARGRLLSPRRRGRVAIVRKASPFRGVSWQRLSNSNMYADQPASGRGSSGPVGELSGEAARPSSNARSAS